MPAAWKVPRKAPFTHLDIIVYIAVILNQQILWDNYRTIRFIVTVRWQHWGSRGKGLAPKKKERSSRHHSVFECTTWADAERPMGWTLLFPLQCRIHLINVAVPVARHPHYFTIDHCSKWLVSRSHHGNTCSKLYPQVSKFTLKAAQMNLRTSTGVCNYYCVWNSFGFSLTYIILSPHCD